MSKLSLEAQRLLDDAVTVDGLSAEHRRRLDAKMAFLIGAAATTAVQTVTATVAQAAVTQATTATATATTATATTAVVSAAKGFSWFAFAATSVGVASVVVITSVTTAWWPRTAPMAVRARHESVAVHATMPARARPSNAEQPMVSPTVSETSREEQPAAAVAPIAPVSVRATARIERHGVADSPRGTLSEETAVLTVARSALRAGRPGDALSNLERYTRMFPRGGLRPAAGVRRAQALCALGRVSEARAEARRWSRAEPGSVSGAAAEQVCGER
jgi:hypothetical protein